MLFNLKFLSKILYLLLFCTIQLSPNYGLFAIQIQKFTSMFRLFNPKELNFNQNHSEFNTIMGDKQITDSQFVYTLTFDFDAFCAFSITVMVLV